MERIVFTNAPLYDFVGVIEDAEDGFRKAKDILFIY